MTGASVRSSTGRTRARALAWVALIATLVIITALIAQSVTKPLLPYASDNPRLQGGRALAQILAQHGVEVASPTGLRDTIRTAKAGTTVFVANASELNRRDYEALLATGADLVLAGSTGITNTIPDMTSSSAHFDQVLSASCNLDFARRAGTLTAVNTLIRVQSSGWITCFPSPQGKEAGAALVTRKIGQSRVSVISSAAIITNANLAKAGNASLLIGLLGKHPQVIWLVAKPGDHLGSSREVIHFTPPWLRYFLVMSAFTAVFLAWWRGHRLGRVVTEPGEVVVPALETVRGRARLYWSGKANAHTAQALRAGCAQRCAQSLGLPARSTSTDLISALERATLRPGAQIEALFFADAPSSIQELTDLAHKLDDLEKEVKKL